MKIKKYTAPSMKEALEKVRQELGNDAIILNTRSNRRGGVLDFMKYAQFEVTAAYDDDPQKKSPLPGLPQSIQPASQDEEKRSAGVYTPARIVPRPSGVGRVPDIRVKELTERVEVERIMEDIRELKRSVQSLAENAALADLGGLPRYLADVLQRLQAAGFDEKIAKGVTRQLLNELTGAELNDRAAIVDRAVELLRAPIGEVCTISMGGTRPRIVAFVGPTGTGKTTTIAKLATEFSLTRGQRVCVLTIDTKRIDAVGQLKSYCRIINIPLLIAYSPDELPGIMPRLAENDIALIDTPGAGPMDRQQMMEMVEFLHRLVPQEVHLTMSVTTSLHEMNRIEKNFNTLKPNRVLFTKLDETDSYGAMLSFAIGSKKNLSYVTFGQNVPGDFSLADPAELLRQCLTPKEEGDR
jgi:flagellar biosynthesis protein FlhF